MTSGISVIAAMLIAFFLVFLIGLLRTEAAERRRLEEDLKKEKQRRIAWEKAAGLPFWSDKETEDALWVRASLERDEMAGDVLETLYFGWDPGFNKKED